MIKPRYPFRDLNIGDSFTAVPPNQFNFRIYCYQMARQLGVRFKVDFNPDASVTVTRIELRPTPTITITRAPKS